MLRHAVLNSCRWSLSALLAAMMVVPAYAADCPACMTGQGACPRCVVVPEQETESAGSTTAVRTCCQNNATAASGGEKGCDSDSRQHDSCLCCMQPLQRTVPGDRATQDIQNHLPSVAHLPAADLPLDSYSASDLSAAAWLASISPPRPHRILHCAWLI